MAFSAPRSRHASGLPPLQVHAAFAIANLSTRNPEAQNAILASGAIPLLLGMLGAGSAQMWATPRARTSRDSTVELHFLS